MRPDTVAVDLGCATATNVLSAEIARKRKKFFISVVFIVLTVSNVIKREKQPLLF
jgi:hypothetical protein